ELKQDPNKYRGANFKKIYFERNLHVVHDDEGEPVHTIVANYADDETVTQHEAKAEDIIVEVMGMLIKNPKTSQAEIARKFDLPSRMAAKRLFDKLKKSGYLNKDYEPTEMGVTWYRENNDVDVAPTRLPEFQRVH